jgi:hypothetical protein
VSDPWPSRAHGRTGQAEANVLDVRDDLFEQLGDVVVVQLVDDLATVTPPDNETEVTQVPKLVRDRGALHGDAAGELVHRRRRGVQAARIRKLGYALIPKMVPMSAVPA